MPTVSDGKLPAETRIDPAHLAVGPQDAADAAELPEESATESSEHAEAPSSGRVLLQQIRVQAEQLGAYLRTRQEDLDHRESQLNARAAQLDHDARTARLWLDERDQELNGREEALAQREQELTARLERIAASDAALRKRADEALQGWTERQRESRVREQSLRERERSLQEGEDELRTGRELWAAERQRAEDALTFQRQQLDAHRVATEQLVRDLHAAVERRRAAAEADIQRLETLSAARVAAKPPLPSGPAAPSQVRALEEVDARYRDLEERRRKLDDEVRTQRRTLAEEQRRAIAAMEGRRQAVERRSRELDEAVGSLERMRQELKAIHRETLEDRLVAEQLWADLAATVPGSMLERGRVEARARLAEELRESRELIGRQRRELESLRGELQAEHDRILKQKHRFETWAARREQELATLAR